jgi:hypothetical protein
MKPSSASRALLAATGLCAAFALFVAITGGIDTRLLGVPVRSRSWERPATLAALFAVVCAVRFRREVGYAAKWSWRIALAAATRVWAVLPALAIAWALCAGLFFGAYAVGGADSSGYVNQAELFARGRLTEPIPLNRAFTWPDVAWTLTPLGYVPNRSRRVLAPSYPPGFPLMMAPLALMQARAVFLLVPICAALAVWCCWRLGLQLGEATAGRMGALLLSVSPTFLYQTVQPMSDVPATACWSVALLLARSARRYSAAAAGLVAGLACLVRPNLAPLGLFVMAAAATVPEQPRLRRLLTSAAAMIPPLILLGVVQSARYGSPLASGYEPFDKMFSLSNVVPNLARYPRWLADTHTPLIWLWIIAPLWFVRAAPRVRPFAWIAWGFSAAVVAAYLPYIYFRPEEWFYTRFLLPALPLMLLLGLATARHAARRLLPRFPDRAVACAGGLLAIWFLVQAKNVGAFDIREAEQKYPVVGAYVRDRLPKSAFVLSMQHSGSIPYYSGRPILRWDVLDRAWLDRAVSSLRDAGYEPFVVVDADEDTAFRGRFAPAAQTALDRLVIVETIGPTRIYAFR